MKTKILILAVLTSIIFTACKKDDDKPSEATTVTETGSLFKKWKQVHWYRDSIDGEILNTEQIWEFINDSIIKRTVEFPNSTEYDTYTITDKWQYTEYDDNSITIEYDSLMFINNNNGVTNSNGTKTYKIKSLTTNELIIEWSYGLEYGFYEKYIFVAE